MHLKIDHESQSILRKKITGIVKVKSINIFSTWVQNNDLFVREETEKLQGFCLKGTQSNYHLSFSY